MINYYVGAYKKALDTPEGKAAEATGEKLNEAFLKIVSGPIYATWEYVASDLPAGERMSYAGAIEVCLDADRLWFSVSPPPKDQSSPHYAGAKRRFDAAVFAEAAVRKAIEKHGYGKVLRWLARRIKLSI